MIAWSANLAERIDAFPGRAAQRPARLAEEGRIAFFAGIEWLFKTTI
jgi:hypothetical protein